MGIVPYMHRNFKTLGVPTKCLGRTLRSNYSYYLINDEVVWECDAPTAELFATNNLLGLRNVFQKTDIHVEYTWIN